MDKFALKMEDAWKSIERLKNTEKERRNKHF